MNISEPVKEAFDHALSFGDSEELVSLLGGLEVTHHYVTWDEFDSNPGAPDAPSRFKLEALLVAGAELYAEAMEAGGEAFILPDDGNGCHVFIAPGETALVKALKTAAAKMEASCG